VCANLIRRCFVSRNVGLLVRAITTYVRPLLEHCNIRSPNLRRDIDSLEQVEGRFTKKLQGFRYYFMTRDWVCQTLRNLKLKDCNKT